MDKFMETLFDENFDIDACLQQFSTSQDFGELRNKLGKLGWELHEKMSHILKHETEAIVILAESLTNVSGKVNRLQEPILQLREEIKLMYEAIKNAENIFLANLEHFKTKNTYFHTVTFQMNLITSCKYIKAVVEKYKNPILLNVIHLERIVTRFAMEMNHLQELDILTTDVQDQVTQVQRQILFFLNDHFFDCYQKDEKDNVIRCLQMYRNMNAHLEAYQTFQKRVVRPALQSIFAMQAQSHSDYNLAAVYERVVEFMQEDMRRINELAELQQRGEFNFILHSFWVEYDVQVRSACPLMGSPGNPDIFRRRFIDTWELLQLIAKHSGDPSLLQKNETFMSHLSQFNLPVYFEIIFQQIATKLETRFTKTTDDSWYCSQPNPILCRLSITYRLYECVLEAYSPSVFIPHMSDSFLKLCNLLIARYLVFVTRKAQESYTERLCIDILHDLQIIRTIFSDDTVPVHASIFNRFPSELYDLIDQLRRLIYRRIIDCVKTFQSVLQTSLSQETVVYLHNVTSIPRLYRRTNRSEPMQPSEYVVQAVAPFRRLQSQICPLTKSSLYFVLDKSIEFATKRYHKILSDVSESVDKTEEALRRFKSRNVNAIEEPSTGLSDEMKIRKQIKLDVSYFIEQLTPMSGKYGQPALETIKPFLN